MRGKSIPKKDYFTPIGEKLIFKILSNFRTEDLADMRLVSRLWNLILCKEIGYGYPLSDSSLEALAQSRNENSWLRLANLAHIDLLSIQNLRTDLTKEKFPEYEKVKQLYVEFDHPLLFKAKFEKAISYAIMNGDFFNLIGKKEWYCEESTVKKENIIWLLENCSALEVICFNTNSLSCFRNSNLNTRPFAKANLQNVHTFLASVGPDDYKPLFHALLLASFPSLKVCILQFKIPVNTFSLEICKALFAFVERVGSTLETLDIKDAPCTASGIIKFKSRRQLCHKSISSINAGCRLIQLKLKRFRLEMRKEVNIGRKLDVEFLKSLVSLTNMSLVGVPVTDIMQAVRVNPLLRLLDIRDIPGHLGPNKPALFDCSCLQDCRALGYFMTDDFRVKNISKLPETVKFLSLMSRFPKDGPIAETKDILFLIERFRCFGMTIQLPSLDHGAIEQHLTKNGNWGGLTIGNSARSKFHRVGALHPNDVKTARKELPKRTVEWILVEVRKHYVAYLACLKAEAGKTRPIVEPPLSLTLEPPSPPSSPEQIRETQMVEAETQTIPESPSQLKANEADARDNVDALKFVLPYLDRNDKKNCRLVSKKWCSHAEKFLAFGFWLNDVNSGWIQNSKLPLSFLAVSKLMTPLEYSKTSFAKNVTVIVIECNDKTFRPDPLGPRQGKGLSKHFIPGEHCSILEENLRFILTCGNDTRCLFLNEWALCNLSSGSDSQKNKLIRPGAFQNLRILSVVVTGIEINHLTNMMKCKFPKLNQLILKFQDIEKTYTMEQYESMFAFIVNHKGTLKRLELYSPPLPPDGRKAKKGSKEQLSESHTKILYEMSQVQLDELIVDCRIESPHSVWGLGRSLIAIQGHLEKLRVRGIDPIILTYPLLSSIKTLTSVELNAKPVGFNELASPTYVFNAQSLKSCNNLTNLNLHNYISVTNLNDIPPSVETMAISLGSVKKSELFVFAHNAPNLQVLALQRNYAPTSTKTFSTYFDIKTRGRNTGKAGKAERAIAQLNRAKMIVFAYGKKADEVSITIRQRRCQNCLLANLSRHKRVEWFDENETGFIPPFGFLCKCSFRDY